MKVTVRILITVCVIMFGETRVFSAKNYYFSHITSDNGLSHNSIKHIIQDSYGFMWFGTKNGLNRYDGETIRIIDCNDRITGHSNNNISTLFEDKDRRLWVGTDKGIFIYDPITEVFTEFTQASANGMQVRDWVSSIEADNEGNIWVISPNEGVFRWNGKYLHHYYVTQKEQYATAHPESMCIRRNGQVWIGTTGEGVFRYYPGNDSFEQFITDAAGNSLKGENIFALCEYGNALALAIHDGELKKYDPNTGMLGLIDAPRVHNTLLRDVKWFGGNELWVATHEGLFVINEEKHTTVHVHEETFNPYAVSDKTCGVIYQDRAKGIWVGTLLGGVNYCANNSLDFDKYIPYDKQEGVLCKKIRGLAEDHHGNIWIGTEDEGVCVLNPTTSETRTIGYRHSKANKLLNTLGMTLEGDELRFGLFKHGLGIINLKNSTQQHVTAKELGIKESSVYAICKDSKGNIWMSTAREVYVKHTGTSNFIPVKGLENIWAFNIKEDSRGNIWFASMGTGLFLLNPTSGTMQQYTHNPSDPSSISSNSTSDIFEDSRGRIWISTDRGGLCRYNEETGDFKKYSIKEGLPDDVIYRVLEDARGILWFGTNRGLVEFDPSTEKSTVYTRKDGLLGQQFNYNAALKDRNGKLWFGGVDGLISFYPERMRKIDYIPPLYITRLTVNNTELSVGEISPLSRSITFTDQIKLSHSESNIGIDFTAVHFSLSSAVEYFYYMENIEKTWISAGDSKKISYSQLPPGDYVFHLKAINRAEGWEQMGRPLRIIICPPWWQTKLAKLLYLLLALGCGATVLHVYWRHRKAQMIEQQKLFEAEKEKELYLSKIEFFSEIAHEVRTPLTLIYGPLEDVISMNTDVRLGKNLHTISKNTHRLLDLTRQLLDFRNVDTNKFHLSYVYTDIFTHISEIAERFEPSINKQNKHFTFTTSRGESFSAAVDSDALTKIVSNLLSNAMKYAVSEVEISLCKDEKTFQVRVWSDGEKIPVNQAEKIFEPFLRLPNALSQQGTGIGLSLARSLAELHQGDLILDTSNTGVGNCFLLTLPLEQNKVLQPEETQDNSAPFFVLNEMETTTESTKNNYTVLLVEDNIAILEYLSGRLRESCTVLTAVNGTEALELLKEQAPDLVVSDVMMPEMDGMELCRQMKQDENLQYIPVVFLTAKNDLQSKIDGLEIGAEAFIEKPFSFTYLKALIFSIMDNRCKERHAFAKRPFVPVHNIRMNKADQEFIDSVIAVIHDNMADEKLNVEYLALVMCTNRSSLLRRIKSITDLSVVDFIKVIRLKKAAEMLIDGKYRINEICYIVGINSASYFSKLFQQQFGMLPKEFERQRREIKKRE